MQHKRKQLLLAASTLGFLSIDVLVFERSGETDWKKID